ncbi:hypothetical protein [Microvirga arabica]|uniref:hypothetical protein n=1 Tax=Microvirga arabica TaxID=1128671 RepID=UPI00193A448B|nr:hypothetical protein [Microvirga arabica]MBM1170141.1 hypothetical protein [Microvirga arabica]
MRLMGTIFVALLALTMAILPISMLQAAAPAVAGHGHTMAVDAGHGHAAAEENHEHADIVAAHGDTALSGSSEHAGNSEDCTGTFCCSMTACHVFQISAPPNLYSPAVSQAPMAMAGDEQVGGITTGGLDRPPRTV